MLTEKDNQLHELVTMYNDMVSACNYCTVGVLGWCQLDIAIACTYGTGRVLVGCMFRCVRL